MIRRRTFAFSTFIFLPAIFFLAACSAPTITPTNVSVAPTIVTAFTPNAPDAGLPTLLPTVQLATPPQVSPVPVTITSIPTVTPLALTATPRTGATALPPTPAESPTPLPEGLPKVFVTALRVEPATPKANEGGTFFVAFQNASGENQAYNWAIEIWDTENNKRPFGLTTPQNSPLPLGASNYTSTGWTVKGLGECHAYRARAVARDEDDNRATFIQSDGSILWLDFTVCP